MIRQVGTQRPTGKTPTGKMPPGKPPIGKRRGGIIILLVLCLVGLVGLLALAIDIGMIAIARSQCQNAADTAAMAGARTINGNVTGNYNFSAVPGNAIQAATKNTVLGQTIKGDPGSYATLNAYTFSSGQITVAGGAFTYLYDDGNPKNEGFKIQFPRQDNSEPYSAVKATVTFQGDSYFARIFGSTSFNTSATATAVHRPRDVVITMDLSGSMRFQSLPGIPPDSSGNAVPSSQTRPRVVSMNPESVFPQFGHYANVAGAALQGTKSYSTGDEMVDPGNISVTTNGGPPIIEDFYQNAAGVTPSSGNRAFTRAPDTQDKAPGGYNYLKSSNNTGASYAKNVNDLVGSKNWNQNFETKGYDHYVTAQSTFYTEGPGYWGKTFFIWPPDPRGPVLSDGSFPDANNVNNHADNGAKDWRQRFFFKYNTNTNKLGWLDHNTILFDPAGAPATNADTTPTPILKAPGDTTTVTENGNSVTYTYRINYAAIFDWLRASPNPFPDQVRAGRIKYYDAIPDPSDTGLNNRFWTSDPLADPNERFWKEYVDFVLGLKGTGAGTYTNTQYSVPLTALIGNGDFFKDETVQLTQKPDPKTATPYQTGTIKNNSGHAKGYNSTIAVNGLSSTPLIGDYAYIGSDPTLYRVTKVPSINSVQFDLPLANAAAQGAKVRFIRQRFMDYQDNPYRPRHQFWFGPMTWVDWLGNYNTNQFWWPGNVHEAQSWAAKVGIQTAIDDIKNNHPNDFLALAYFSDPKYSNSDYGQHNQAIVPLGRNYQQLKDSLWFPPSTITGTAKEVTPYEPDFDRVPRAKGGTAPGMGLMIAYNLLSSSTSSLRFYSQPQPQYRGNAGGLGRKGATRIVILETDGAPNTRAAGTLVNQGSDSYYKIRLKNPANPSSSSNVEWPSGSSKSVSYSDTEVFNVVDQITKLETANPPGYSSTRKPALIYSLGYGTLFDPSNPSKAQTDALTFLQTVSFKGNTAKTTNPSDFPDSRRIYGTNQQRIDRIRAAFTDIMQSGVQVSLIE